MFADYFVSASTGIAAFRHQEAILRLTQYCEQNRPDYGAMTDEELERAIGELGGRPEGKTLP